MRSVFPTLFLAHMALASQPDGCSDGTCSQDEATLLQLQGVHRHLSKQKAAQPPYTFALADSKCPFEHGDRLFRYPDSGSNDVTLQQCYAQCAATPGCNHFSHGAWEGAFVCMGCTTLENAHTHAPFTAYDMNHLSSWPQHEVDYSKCNRNENLVCVRSQEACQAEAEANGHEWYSFRFNVATRNECNGEHKCFSSSHCDDALIGDRTNQWKIFKKPFAGRQLRYANPSHSDGLCVSVSTSRDGAAGCDETSCRDNEASDATLQECDASDPGQMFSFRDGQLRSGLGNNRCLAVSTSSRHSQCEPFTLAECSEDNSQQFTQEEAGGSTVWRNAGGLAIDSDSWRNTADNWIWACPGTNTAKYFDEV